MDRALSGRGPADHCENKSAGWYGTADLTMLPLVATGLLDGINPCAFTTLIFLISASAVAGRTRRELFVLGLFCAASVFVTYYL